MKTKSMTIWVMVLVLCVSSSQVMAWIQYNDGGTHDITTTINDDVWVDWDSPGVGTTVNMLEGGSIADTLKGFEDSIINILGGSIGHELYSHDSSRLNISGGTIGGQLHSSDFSQVDISGGLIAFQLSIYGSSQVNISGGTIGYRFYSSDSSQVNISGGSIKLFELRDSSQVNISGGSIGENLLLSENAVLTIDGSDFAVDGQSVDDGKITSITGGPNHSEPYRHLTGILANGDLLDNDFRIGHDASIVLVPEPATLLLLGLGAVMVRRRKR